MNQPQVEPKPTQKPVEEIPVHSRLMGASFVNSVTLNGEHTSVNLGRNIESIWPARIEADGSACAIKDGQQAQGVLIRTKVRDGKGGLFVAQAFVGWANIRALNFG